MVAFIRSLSKLPGIFPNGRTIGAGETIRMGDAEWELMENTRTVKDWMLSGLIELVEARAHPDEISQAGRRRRRRKEQDESPLETDAALPEEPESEE